MEQNHAYHNPVAAEIISRKASAIARKCGSSRLDAEDVAQELTLHAVSRDSEFDPDRPGTTLAQFYERIFRNRGIDLIRKQRAEQRDLSREVGSLNDTTVAATGRPAKRADTIPECSHRPTELNDLKIDIAEFVDGLPQDLRQLLKAKRDGRVVELMSSPGWSRRIYERRFADLVRACYDAGLDVYVDERAYEERHRVDTH